MNRCSIVRCVVVRSAPGIVPAAFLDLDHRLAILDALGSDLAPAEVEVDPRPSRASSLIVRPSSSWTVVQPL